MGMNRYLFIHELRQNARSLTIWTLAISACMIMCVFLFPEMSSQLDSVGSLFASMGAFSAAFGMDLLNFGSFIGFYAIECGNIMLLGGAMFAALLGVQMLSKEEDQQTAEFLLSQPVSRTAILSSKWLAGLLLLVIFNVLASALMVLSVWAIDEPVPWKDLFLLHGAFACLQVELFCICFCFSAFMRHSVIGLGLGMSIGLYFLQLIANLSDSASWLSFLTPFGYTDAATIITEQALDGQLLLIGAAVSVFSTLLAFVHYSRKDIYA